MSQTIPQQQPTYSLAPNLPLSGSQKKQQTQIEWVAVVVDNQYYLTTPAAYQKLQMLDQEISQEKCKLDQIHGQNQQKRINCMVENNDRQKVEDSGQREKKVRKNSFQSELSRECKTEINELKALRAKIKIEKQLAQQESKYQNKTIEMRKRRELKDETTFIIKNQNQNHSNAEDIQRKSKKQSAKNFIMAPNQLVSNRKSTQKQEQTARPQILKPKVSQKEKNESISIKYRTIEVKSIKSNAGSILQGGNTVKMSTISKDRYNENSQARSKQKSFIITSRKAPSSNSKEHRESFVSGLKQGQVDSSSQIKKLSSRLKEMQQKLQFVEKRQRELQESEVERQKVLAASKQKSHAQSRASSKINQVQTIKKTQKCEKQQIKDLGKLRKQQRMAKLSISNEIVAYNYSQDVEKQKKQAQKTDDKQKMSNEIDELKKLIKQLKIDKIRQEAKIEDLQQKQNKKTNNFMLQDNSLMTFNAEESRAASQARDNKSNILVQNELALNQKESFESAYKIDQSKQYKKKEPRRVLKIDSNHKIRASRPESPASINSKNKTFSLNSSQIQKQLNEISFNPEEPSRQELSVLRKKGVIIRQIINKEKFNFIADDKKEQENETVQEKNSKKTTEVNDKKLSDVQGQIDLTQFEKPEVNVPEFEMIQGFPIPNLPSPPLPTTTQSQILNLAKNICDIFEIKVDGKEQLQFKKFKNCVILRTPENNKAIVWHYSGKFYVGGWDLDQSLGEDHKNGEGFEFVPEKHYYRGHFKSGKRNGHGTMITVDGDIYKGQWFNGQRNGQGIYYDKKLNAFYSGEWKQGKKDGLGIYKISEKQFYQGKFQKSIKSGNGAQCFANGDLYIGEYKNNKFHGSGKYYWSNGSVYIGAFIEGERQGEGKWLSSTTDGDLYIGTYKKDKKEGNGKYRAARGWVFEGTFKSDLKHGQGKVEYQDGREVRGLWQFGKLKTIYKSEIQPQPSEQSQYSLDIEPRIRPNMPRIIETPSRQMQESRYVHGV